MEKKAIIAVRTGAGGVGRHRVVGAAMHGGLGRHRHGAGPAVKPAFFAEVRQVVSANRRYRAGKGRNIVMVAVNFR